MAIWSLRQDSSECVWLCLGSQLRSQKGQNFITIFFICQKLFCHKPESTPFSFCFLCPKMCTSLCSHVVLRNFISPFIRSEWKKEAARYSVLQKSQKSYFIESYVNCMQNKEAQTQTHTCQDFLFHIHHFTQANKPTTSFSRLHLHTAYTQELAPADPRAMWLLARLIVPLRHEEGECFISLSSGCGRICCLACTTDTIFTDVLLHCRFGCQKACFVLLLQTLP